MIKRLIALAALAVALLAFSPSSAESVCADAGATGLVPAWVGHLDDGGVKVKPVCVWVP